MRSRLLIALLMVLFSSLGFRDASASVDVSALTQYLTLPNSDCGLQWFFNPSLIDSIKANPHRSIGRLTLALTRATSKNDVVQMASLHMDLSDACAALDSSAAVKRHANEAYRGFVDVFSRTPTAFLAYQSGRAAEALNKDDDARGWYRRAYEVDPTCYQACFRMAEWLSSSAVTTDSVEAVAWLRRADALMVESMRPGYDSGRATDIAFQYAMLSTSLGMGNKFLRMFDTIVQQMRSTSDSATVESLVVNQFKDMFGAFCSPAQIAALREVNKLDPSNVPCRIALSASELGTVFFGSINSMLENQQLDSQAMIRQWIASHRKEIVTARARLASVPSRYQQIYPSVHFFRAFASCMLGEQVDAKAEILTFIRYRPDVEAAYGMHCGIILQLESTDQAAVDRHMLELLTMGQWQCKNHPSASVWYRMGYLRWMSGDNDASYASLQMATTFGGKDVSPRIGLAVMAYLRGDVALAGTIARSFSDDEVSGNAAMCRDILLAVLAAGDDDLPTAMEWADKASHAESDNSNVQGLLNALRQR